MHKFPDQPSQRIPGSPGRALAIGTLLMLAGLSAPRVADAQIFRCDSPDGTPLFQNAPGKNCRALDLPPLNTVPAPRLPAGAAPRAAAGASAVTPAAFPRVDPALQRGRDSDRRRILEDELGREQSKLSGLRKEFNGGEPERLGDERNYQKYLDRVERLKQDLTRSESNVASLRRELEGLK